MTTSKDLLDATKAALLGPGVDANPISYSTAAEDRVFRPGDWPTWDQEFPATKLRVVSEDKQSMGKGGVKFLVTATIRILSQVSAPASDEDGGASEAEDALWALKEQNERAVINSYPLTGLLQQFAFIRSSLVFTSEGEKHLAGVQTDIGMEFVQDEDDFFVLPTAPFEEIAIEDTAHPRAGITIILPQ